jgi:hypothetical protein
MRKTVGISLYVIWNKKNVVLEQGSEQVIIIDRTIYYYSPKKCYYSQNKFTFHLKAKQIFT